MNDLLPLKAGDYFLHITHIAWYRKNDKLLVRIDFEAIKNPEEQSQYPQVKYEEEDNPQQPESIVPTLDVARRQNK